MRAPDPLPLVVAAMDDGDDVRAMARVARLAAAALRRGRLADDHPTADCVDGEPGTLFGVRASFNALDPLLAGIGDDLRTGMREVHAVAEIEFQKLSFHLLPIDRSRHAATVSMDLREDRAELDPDGVPLTNHDFAALADRIADMASSAVHRESDEALEGLHALEEAGRLLRCVALADLGARAELEVMSQDHGSDLVVIAWDATDDGPDVDHRFRDTDLHFDPALRLALATHRPQVVARHFTDRSAESMRTRGGRARWPLTHVLALSRRAGPEPDGSDGPDPVEAMRGRRRFAHLAAPLVVRDAGGPDVD